MIRFCDDCCNHICTMLGRCERRAALAAAAREGGDVKQAPAESPQSGHEVATPALCHPSHHQRTAITMADQCLNCFSTKLDAAGGCLSCGRKSDEQHPNSPNSSPELTEALGRLRSRLDYSVGVVARSQTVTPRETIVRKDDLRAAIEALSSKNELPASAPPVMGMEGALRDELEHFIDIIDGTEATGFDPHVEQMLMDAAENARKLLSTPLVTGRE